MKKSMDINLGELFARFLESKEEANTFEVPMGKVSKEICQKFKAWKKEKRELDDELEIEQERLARKFKRELEEMFDEKMDLVTEKKKAIWEDIYKELGIDKKDNETYTINAVTGEVSKEIKKTDVFGTKSHGLQ